MKNQHRIILFVFIMMAVLLASCSSQGAPASEPSAADSEAESSNVEQSDTEADADVAEAAEVEGCLGSAEDAIVDLNCREVSVAIENAYPPFNYVLVETGEPEGWDYDAWDEICRRLHCKPVYIEAAWEGMIQAVADGQFDAAGDGITITEDRAEIVDFSVGYVSIEQRLLVRLGDDRFSSIEEFVADENLVLGTQTGTTNYETAVKYLPESRIQAFEQFPFAVQALISGDVDAVIIDETAGQGYMGENKEDVELIGPSISSDELGFIYPKGSDLVEPVDQAIEAMLSDGFIDELNVKYFGPDFNVSSEDIGPGVYGDESEEDAESEEAGEEESADSPEGCRGTAEDAIVDLECRQVLITVENAYPPFNYILVETGEPDGWDYDVWDEICVRLHCEPVYVESAWEGMIQAVADGQFDVGADGVTITEDRAEIVDFSMGYVSIEQRLLVRKGDTRFANIEEFVADESLMLGTQTGTTNYETAAKYLPETRIQAFEQFPFAVQALISGDVDAVIIDETAGQGYMGENKEDVELIGPSISSDQLGFLYPKGSELVEPVDQAIQSMMDDGFIDEVNKKYFGPDFNVTSEDME